MKMYRAIDVAKEFLTLHLNTNPNKNDFTHLKIQRLVYISHGWNLGLFEERLIKEDVEAWQHGPVIRELHEILKRIRRPLEENDFPTDAEKIKEERSKKLVKKIFDVYGKHTAGKLVDITYKEGTPWYKTTEDNISFYKTVIPVNDIKGYYEKLANNV